MRSKLVILRDNDTDAKTWTLSRNEQLNKINSATHCYFDALIKRNDIDKDITDVPYVMERIGRLNKGDVLYVPTVAVISDDIYKIKDFCTMIRERDIIIIIGNKILESINIVKEEFISYLDIKLGDWYSAKEVLAKIMVGEDLIDKDMLDIEICSIDVDGDVGSNLSTINNAMDDGIFNFAGYSSKEEALDY